jgi:hypothetical protein
MAPTTTTTAPTTSTAITTTVLSPVTTQPAEEPAASPFFSIWLPILAIAISLWSAYNSWRSRQTSERSAGLTEQRRQEEQAPSIEYVGVDAAPDEGIRIMNEATVAYTSVRFTIVPSLDEPAPIDALQVDYNEPGVGWQPRWIQEGEPWDLGPLGPGESRLLDLRRPDQRGWPTTARTLRLILDCTTTDYPVSVIRTCEIPPRPPVPFIA